MGILGNDGASADKDKQIADLIKERDDLQGKLDAANKKLSATKPAAATPAKARKIDDGLPVADRASLAALFGAPGQLEVVPSYTGREVTGLGGIAVIGTDFAKTGDQFKFSRPVVFTPDQTVTIDGFALFGSDGKQVAYTALPEPVLIPARQSVGLSDTIAF